MDPLAMTYGRFMEMWNLIPDVVKQFTPKSPLQAQLDAKEAQINAYLAERKRKAQQQKYLPWEV